MPQDQILRTRRRPNRISLHEPHLLQRAIECGWPGKIPGDSVAPQVVESHGHEQDSLRGNIPA
jgi:hypothetical protein